MSVESELRLAQAFHELRGAPMTLLMALLVLRRPANVTTLHNITGYDWETVRLGLAALADFSYARNLGGHRGWTFTRAIYQQLPLLAELLEGESVTQPRRQLAAGHEIAEIPRFEREIADYPRFLSGGGGTVNDVNFVKKEPPPPADQIADNPRFEREIADYPRFGARELLPDAAYTLIDELVDLSLTGAEAEAAIRAGLAIWPAVDDVAEHLHLWRTWYEEPVHCRGLVHPIGVVIASKLVKGVPGPLSGHGRALEIPADTEARIRYYLPEGYEDLINP